MIGLNALSPERRAVVEWQLGICGGFKTALWKAIEKADEGNLRLLARGFPDEVGGFIAFTREPGWWDSVQQSLDAS